MAAKQQTILEVLITARDEMRTGVTSASASLDKLATSASKGSISLVAVAGAAVGATAAFVGMLKATGDEAEELRNLSQQLGLSTDAIQEYGFAARVSGIDFGVFQGAIRTLTANLEQAEEGTESAQKKFDRLGVSWERLIKLNTEDRIRAIADAIQKVDDPTTRMAAAFDLLGRSGNRLIPILGDGADGLDKFAAAARESGNVLSGAEIARGEAIDDLFDTWIEGLKGMAKQSAQATIGLASTVIELGKFAGFAGAGAMNTMMETLSEPFRGLGKFGQFKEFAGSFWDEVMGGDPETAAERDARFDAHLERLRALIPVMPDEMSEYPVNVGLSESIASTEAKMIERGWFERFERFKGDYSKWLRVDVAQTPVMLDPVVEQFERMGHSLRDGLADSFSQSLAMGQAWGDSMSEVMHRWAISALFEINRIILKLMWASLLKAFVSGGSLPSISSSAMTGSLSAAGVPIGPIPDGSSMRAGRGGIAPDRTGGGIIVVNVNQQVGFGSAAERFSGARELAGILRELRFA